MNFLCYYISIKRRYLDLKTQEFETPKGKGYTLLDDDYKEIRAATYSY